MKIKIERYEYSPSEHRYRAYHGFTGIPYTYPFHTKWVLDKDILVKGNKVYSPQTCCFVPQEINVLLTNCRKRRGECPIGVSFIKAKQKFSVSLAYDGKNKTIGHFDNPLEAFNAYKKAKELRIKELADKWKEQLEPRVYEALYNYKVEITD